MVRPTSSLELFARVVCWGLPAALLLAAGALAQPAAQPADAVLAEGNPPLMQSDVDAWKRLVETAFGVPLTQDQSASLQQQLVADWQEADNPQRSQLTQAQAAWARLGGALGAQRETLRLGLREQLLDAAGRQPDGGVSKIVHALYDQASPVLVDATPPLRRGSVEALASLLEWLASQVGAESAKLTDVERAQLVARVVERYPHLASGDQILLQHMEETVAWLQRQWEKAGPEGQANFRLNLARGLGVEATLPPAPYAGETDTWEHPDGLFNVDYPADWSARYGGLPAGAQAAGWSLLDVSVLGDAPSAALELGALPNEGALLIAATLPPEVVSDRMTVEEGVLSLAHELLTPFGAVEPLAEPAVGQGAVLTTWTQHSADGEYAVWVSAVLLPQPRGAAIVTLCRAPSARKTEVEPALSRVLYSLRLGDSSDRPLSDLQQYADTDDLVSDLLNTPLSDQMDMIEALTTGVR